MEFVTGNTVPLKFTIPVEAEMTAPISPNVCTLVPLKFNVPELVKEPLLVRSPSSVMLPVQKLKELGATSIKQFPATEIVALLTV